METENTSNTNDTEMVIGQGGPMMNGGMMGGGMPTEMTASTQNEWLVPMTATGIIAGSIVMSAVAICIMIWFAGKKIGSRKD